MSILNLGFAALSNLGVLSPKAQRRFKPKTIRHKTLCPEKRHFVVKTLESRLTKEDTPGQKGEFLDVDENKPGIQKSEYTGEVSSREMEHRRCGESDEGGGGSRCKATSPGNYSGKALLHSLELEHVRNCDTMQQAVAVVKPTGHKSRRQALGLVQVPMFSDSAQAANVTVGKFANIVDLSPEIKILIKHNTKIFSNFQWVSLTAKESDRKHEKAF